MKKVKLFCIPYAGGSATVYKRIFKSISESIEIRLLELPGRGIRFSEPLLYDMNETVDDLFSKNRNEFMKGSYALFGYSMGSWIAYELMQKIKQERILSPIHAFLSAQQAPSIEKTENLHILPRNEFIDAVADLKGIPEEVLDNKELLDIFIPILYSDYQLVEKYHYTEGRGKLDCSFTILEGTRDTFNRNNIECWAKETDGECVFHYYDGGHFFINKFEKEISGVVYETLYKEGTVV